MQSYSLNRSRKCEWWDQAVADCAAQLGSADSWYGSGDVGQDTEAVRAALSALAPFGYGYDLVDYYGISGGGADIAAYATRFGSHLRSFVGVAVGATRRLYSPFVDDRYRSRAARRAVSMDCNYSPTCAADHPIAEGEFDALVWTIELSPVQGYAYDANGNLQYVVVDENALLNYALTTLRDATPAGAKSLRPRIRSGWGTRHHCCGSVPKATSRRRTNGETRLAGQLVQTRPGSVRT